jgi:hypothetical protein
VLWQEALIGSVGAAAVVLFSSKLFTGRVEEFRSLVVLCLKDINIIISLVTQEQSSPIGRLHLIHISLFLVVVAPQSHPLISTRTAIQQCSSTFWYQTVAGFGLLPKG